MTTKYLLYNINMNERINEQTISSLKILPEEIPREIENVIKEIKEEGYRNDPLNISLVKFEIFMHFFESNGLLGNENPTTLEQLNSINPKIYNELQNTYTNEIIEKHLYSDEIMFKNVA